MKLEKFERKYVKEVCEYLENKLNDKNVLIDNLENKIISLEKRMEVLENKRDKNETNNSVVTNVDECRFISDPCENDDNFPPNIPQLDGGLMLEASIPHFEEICLRNTTTNIPHPATNSFVMLPCGFCGMSFGGEHLRQRHHKKCKKKKQMMKPTGY